MKQSGGSFVVAYDSSFSSTLQVKVAEVSASNAVTTFDAGEQRFNGAVSIDGFNNYMLTYTRSQRSLHPRPPRASGLIDSGPSPARAATEPSPWAMPIIAASAPIGRDLHHIRSY